MDVNRKRPEWREYFMDFARHAAKRSDCIRSQVGAIIVNKRNKVRGTGYNNTPAGVESCLSRKQCYRIEHNIPSGTCYETCRSIHAEQNAIIQAGEDNCVGSSLYVFGHTQVCILCKRFIINVGIERIYLKKDEASEIMELDPKTWLSEL